MNETAAENNEMKLFDLHLVSDSTGETLNYVASACVAQFDGIDAEHHHWSLIRTEGQMRMVCDSITARPGAVLFTVINDNLRQMLIDHCRSLKVPCIPAVEHVLSGLSHFWGVTAKQMPGRQHILDKDYYQRIEAMEFALACDDGQGLDKIHKADVVIIGVSRTSKSPTCLYLANRSLFAANIPIVAGVDLPQVLFELSTPLIVGLTRDPASLVDIRRNRLRFLNETTETPYIDIDSVAEEVKQARKICQQHNWPLIDVSRRSIEETAAEIMIQLNRREAEREAKK